MSEISQHPECDGDFKESFDEGLCGECSDKRFSLCRDHHEEISTYSHKGGSTVDRRPKKLYEWGCPCRDCWRGEAVFRDLNLKEREILCLRCQHLFNSHWKCKIGNGYCWIHPSNGFCMNEDRSEEK